MLTIRNEKPASPRKIRWLYYSGVFLLGFLMLEAITLLSGYCANSYLKRSYPKTSAFIRDHELKSKHAVQHRHVPLSQISPRLIKAVVISEDDAFFDHEGIDMDEMKESWELNLKKGRIVRGGSTITMQLTKNLYLNSNKSPLRKINEIILALDMENKLPKERILESYLNIVEWGPGIYGAEAASRYYFNKPASRLTSAEAAYLAALLPNPHYLTGKGKRRAARRKQIILRRMARRRLNTNFN